jgi:hypothetical protein
LFTVHKTEASAVGAVEQEGFAPLAALHNTLRFWWVVFLLTVIGGAAGLLFHRFNPSVYEAVGRFTASIDFVATGPLTQFEEDVALNAVQDVVFSSDVINKVAVQAQAEGIDVRADDLYRIAVIERKVNVWILRVRHSDPAVAKQIAQIWVTQGHAVLLESYAHAVQAQLLSRYVQALENCLSSSAASEPSHGLCNQHRFDEIQADLRDAGQALIEERKASRNLFAGLTIGSVDQAVVSSSPVLYGRSPLVLAGSLLGFILGVLLNQFGLPARWMRRS